MRFVTALIVLLVGAAVYLANTAPRTPRPSGGPENTAPVDVASADAGEPGRSPEDRAAERERLLAEAEAARFSDDLDRRSGFTPVDVRAEDGAEAVQEGAVESGAAEATTVVEQHDSRATSRDAAAEEALDPIAAITGAPAATGTTLRRPDLEPVPSDARRGERGAPTLRAPDLRTPDAPRPGEAVTNEAPVVDVAVPDAPVADEPVVEGAVVADEAIVDEPLADEVRVEDASLDAAETVDGAEVALDAAGGADAPAVEGGRDAADASESDTASANEGRPANDETAGPEAANVGELGGSVVETTGANLRGIGVTVRDLVTGDALARTKTDRDGTFHFTGLRAGRVRVDVDPATVPLGVAAPVGQELCRGASVAPGFGAPCVEVGHSDLRIELPLSSGLQGTVHDRRGRAVKGAAVRAIPRIAGFTDVRPETSTDAEGGFFLAVVPAEYALEIVLPEGYGSLAERTRRIDVNAEEGAALILDTIDYAREPEAPSKPLPLPGSHTRSDTAAAVEASAPAQVAARAPEGGDEERIAAPAPVVVGPAFAPGGTATRQSVPVEIDVVAREELRAPVVDDAEAPGAVEDEGTEVVDAAPAASDAPDVPEPRADVADAEPLPTLGGAESPDEVASADGTLGGDDPAPSDGDDEDPAPAAKEPKGATLRGRVVTRWGESIDGLPIVCFDESGERVAEARSAVDGTFTLTGVPAGVARIHVAPDAPLDAPGPGGAVLRERPEPLVTRPLRGEGTAQLEHIVVDVAPVFRIAGRIHVSADALAAFREALTRDEPSLGSLSDASVRRIYLRGLRLTKRNKGGAGRARTLEIASDGTFEWSCNLPAQDVEFVLESRAGAGREGYGVAVGVEVTPAGVRTAPLVVNYPPRAPESEGLVVLRFE